MEVAPTGEHRATVIWLHGLGADGHDFEPVVPELRLPAALGVGFLFPEAPHRPVTINAGTVMRAWFDIESLNREGTLNRMHLAEAVSGVRALLEVERQRGIPPERQVLAGFSQGGAVALHAATAPTPEGKPPLPVAGVVALSTYLPDLDTVAPPGDPAVPIFQAHGSFDPMIPFGLAIRTQRALTDAGWPVEFHEYPMAHQVSAPEIQDIGRFLRRVLADGDGGTSS